MNVSNYGNLKTVVRTIRVEDDKVYVAAGPGGIIIFDVADPAKPKQVGKFETGGYIFDVSKSGFFIFAANEKSKMCHLFRWYS